VTAVLAIDPATLALVWVGMSAAGMLATALMVIAAWWWE
jgi:hypothetical protein